MTDITVDPRGPVLVCYRQDDGADLAHSAAAALRAVGIPVWLDKTDMGVGRFDHTFRRAAESGLSGTVFTATPNVSHSDFIRNDEAPVWEALSADPDFILGVINAGPQRQDGDPDYTFPDSLLKLREQRLANFQQYPVSEAGWLDRLVRDVAERRLTVIATGTGQTELRVEVQTRDEPSSNPSQWDLRATIGPASDGATVLGAEEAGQVRMLTRELSALASRLQRSTLRLRGGFHLPVAVALGLAFPTVRPGRVVVHDNEEGEWDSRGVGTMLDLEHAHVGEGTGEADGIAVLVDLVPGAAAEGFEHLVQTLALPGLILRSVNRDRIQSEDGNTIAAQLADAIRDFAGSHGTYRVHLCLRAPAALAVHIGRHLNTLALSLYDHDRTTRRYVHFADAQAGGPAGNVLIREFR